MPFVFPSTVCKVTTVSNVEVLRTENGKLKKENYVLRRRLAAYEIQEQASGKG
jgi:regulator of replication initiation timing